MKLRRNTDPRRLCAARAGETRAERVLDRRDEMLWLVMTAAAAAIALCIAGAAGATETPDAPKAAVERPMRRVDILLDPTAFPEHDRAASQDRLEAIAAARASKLPLFRSFDPRETLRDTLALLSARGVEVGPSAIVNFDSIEAWMPADAKKALAELPFVKRIRKPVAPVQAGLFDSEGVPLTGADVAQAAGITGTGITVAVIDKDYQALTDTITDPNDELYAIPTSDMFEQATSSSPDFNNPVDLDGHGSREHGTASAEVIYEMAPGATIKLYRVKSTTGIEYAIRHAADNGVDVIQVPLTHIETMSDPVGTGDGGTNRFTDDIDYAVAAGSVVVVAGGNEALRHLETTYQPCTECVDSDPNYICNTASNNLAFHKFSDPFDELPLNALTFDDDHYDAESIDLTCWSAIEEGFDPTEFKMKLYTYNEGSLNDEPLCPGDAGASPVSGTERNLGEFFEKTVPIFNVDYDEQYYYLTVRYTDPSHPLATWPKFRIACGNGVEEMLFYASKGSLSDLAVVESAITVAEVDAFFEDEVTETSSRGPAASGPQKPDIGGPGTVENFAVTDFDFVADWTFNGTSAASAHVAGIVALMQDYRVQNGLPLLTQAQAKQWLTNAALPIETDDPVEGVTAEDKVGHGLAQVPMSTFEGDVGPLDFYSITPCRVLDTRTAPGPTDGTPEKLKAGVERLAVAAGACGIPASARAVSGILSVVAPSTSGFLTMFPGDDLRPGVSAVNFGPGGVTNNNIFLKLASNGTGTFRVYLPVGTADLVFDVNGYFQ